MSRPGRSDDDVAGMLRDYADGTMQVAEICDKWNVSQTGLQIIRRRYGVLTRSRIARCPPRDSVRCPTMDELREYKRKQATV